MKNGQMDFASIIADFFIRLNAFSYSFTDPKQWSDGTYNPVSENTAKLICPVDCRQILAKAMASLIVRDELRFIDWIYGINSDSLGFATLMAVETKKPLLVKVLGDYYLLKIHDSVPMVEGTITDLMKSVDEVIGASSFGAVFGIMLADKLEKPFYSVNINEDHRSPPFTTKWPAGKGSSAVLVNPLFKSIFEPRSEELLNFLESTGVDCLPHAWDRSTDVFTSPITSDDINGKTIVTVEDVVRTGRSSTREIKHLSEWKARVIPTSLLNYGLLSEETLEIRAVLKFQDVMRLHHGIPKEDEEKLWGWYDRQKKWGDLHGFPALNVFS